MCFMKDIARLQNASKGVCKDSQNNRTSVKLNLFLFTLMEAANAVKNYF